LEGFAEKEGFKSGMKERVGDEKLIIISVAVRGINDHIRFYSQMLCTAAINTLPSNKYYARLAAFTNKSVIIFLRQLTT